MNYLCKQTKHYTLLNQINKLRGKAVVDVSEKNVLS